MILSKLMLQKVKEFNPITLKYTHWSWSATYTAKFNGLWTAIYIMPVAYWYRYCVCMGVSTIIHIIIAMGKNHGKILEIKW